LRLGDAHGVRGSGGLAVGARGGRYGICRRSGSSSTARARARSIGWSRPGADGGVIGVEIRGVDPRGSTGGRNRTSTGGRSVDGIGVSGRAGGELGGTNGIGNDPGSTTDGIGGRRDDRT
jgi:hypothetical protein